MNKQISMIKELNELREFLNSKGYVCWDTKNETIGYINIVTQRLQRRVDNVYNSLPVCNTNNKLCIDISIAQVTMNGATNITAELELCHENKQEEWCSLKIYALSDEEVYSNLEKYETKLLEMWKVFHG